MDHKYLIFGTLILLFAAYSCTNKDEDERLFPKVKTLDVSNITDEGAVFNGSIEGVLTNKDITDHGFCYGFPDEKAPLGYTKVSLGKLDESENSFQAQVSSDLLKDQTYTVIAYIKASNRIIYGTSTSFVSKGGLGPEIKSFAPQVAGWGDTIKISGKNFSDKVANNIVRFDQVKATIVSASDSALRVVVPVDLSTQKSTIGVTTAEKTFLALQPFQIGKPVIKDLTAKVPFGGTLDIKTQNVNGKLATFYVDGTLITSTQVSINEHSLTIPKTYSYGAHTLRITVFTENTEGSFQYEAPYISDISPKQASWNDKLTIKGKNFKAMPENTRIDFQGSECSTYNYTIVNDSVIQLKVPDCVTVTKCNIGLLNNYFTTYFPTQLSMTAPELQSIENNQFCIGDNVTVEGKGIQSSETKLYFDGKYVDSGVFFKDSTHVQFSIPEALDAGSHKLRVKVGQLESNEIDFSIKKLIIKSITEGISCRSGRLTIVGENFARYSTQNTVTVNGTQIEVIERGETFIKVRLPYNQLISSNPEMVVQVGLQQVVINTNISIIEPWEKVSELNVEAAYGAKFTIGNKFYFSTGSLGDGQFYCYNTDDKSLKQIADYPGGRVIIPVCFVMGSKAYVGLGNKTSLQKFWSYDSNTDRWDEIADCPLDAYSLDWANNVNRAFSFVTGDYAFVGNTLREFYKYNSNTNKWIACNPSTNIYLGNINVGFTVGENCFVVSGNNISVSEYSPVNDVWQNHGSREYNYTKSMYDATYVGKLNKLIFNGYRMYRSEYSGLQYFDPETKKIGFFFPAVSYDINLFSTEDGRLFSMYYDTKTNKQLIYEFNFSKYEQIKSLIDGN